MLKKSKVNEIFANTNTLQENQIKGEQQLTDLVKTVNFFLEKIHEFEVDRKLKEEIIELKEKFHLRDIWRIRNPKTKRYTFRQKHVSGLIQRRLDYFYISNSMQVSVKNTDVLASLLTDHSPITFSYCKNEESNRGRGLWKFNNSLIENEEYVHQMKKFIPDTFNELFSENVLDGNRNI